MPNTEQKAQHNLERIAGNPYPGRGIVIGLSEDSRHIVQIYWIMGRSVNSRNRKFVIEGDFVKNEAVDPAKLSDPSLIIYYPLKSADGRHIVSNGDQTDTIFDSITKGGTLEDALLTRTYEPDEPNYTPRISGLVDTTADARYAYQLSILKRINERGSCGRFYYNYEQAVPGIGHCIHTYAANAEPLPTFAGEPFEVKLAGKADSLAKQYWDLLNEDNRIALLVKTIDVHSGEASVIIRNQYSK
ncbi:IMP cyclohydrolase [Paenibacillus kobensis]|uniref:IMP cyclohydrolase n=1 Tax=Paenibacillus kobensis TaxID=59841 RepID=UPI000FD7D330|nr:IMP cyclohydrolase [Paenibacillus kobensis]